MLLAFMLWLIVWRVRFRLWLVSITKKTLFVEIKALSLVIEIKTNDKKIYRNLELKNGKLNSSTKALPKSADNSQSICLIFADAKEAPQIIRALKKDKQQIFSFIHEKKIQMEGDFSVIQSLFAIKEKLEQA